MKKLISALSSLCLAATSLLGAFPAVRAENAVTAQAADSLVYNLIPNGKTYDSAEEKGTKNNVYKAEAGESLKIDWTVKGDPGTAGIQMNFDFTQVTYESASRGNAYRIVPTYSDYKTTTNLKQGECIYTWAQSEENKADDGKVIYSFTVTVPSAEGTYSVGLKSGEENKVVPIDQTKTIPFTFHGLDIVVGSGGGNPQPSGGDGLIYNLVPNGKTYDSAETKGTKNNVYKAEAGESLKIDWTVKGDPGTAGIQMNFDFTQVTYESASRGNAYRIVPTYSDYKTTTNLKQGECIYTWAQSEENKADDGKVIYSFTVTVPSAEGTYSVGLKSGEENKVVPIDQTKTIPFTFHGLDIVVGSGGGNPQPSGGDGLIYNLVPNGKTYDSAETKGTKNNVYKAEAGESLKIDWTVKGDPGTAGIQMNFDFTQVTYESASRGNAYRIVPTYSDYKSTTNLKQGECIYTWAQSEENKADDGKVIYSFTVTVPSAEGTYSVGLKSGEENKVVPIDQTKTIPFTFHGLDIVVGSGGGNPQPSGGDGLIYNLVPNGKTYDSAETKGTKNNVYKAEAGESLKIDWTVKGDPGTAGIQMNFDFTQVTYESASRGNAYRIVPTYSDYKSTTNLKQGECIYTWAQSEENKADDGKVIYSFTVTVPSAEGTYSVGLKSGEENKVVPIDQTKTIPFTFHGLDIVVGSGGGNPQPSGGDGLIYNLVPNGKTYDSAETKGTKNNVYKAEAGESLKIDWTVKGDPGTAGIQMNFDFTQVTYESASRGNAYRIVPTYSDYKSTTNLKQGECIYTWAQSEENKADDGKVIYSFTVTVPSAEGTYSVGLKSGEENKVVPIDQTKTIPFTFHGLDIVVGSGGGNPQPSGGDGLIYNLVPNGKTYDSAETKGTKNNVYKAEAGESLKIDWTVKGDPGTAGIQMNFDFTQVDYVSGSRGSAYRIVPTYSDYKTTEKLIKGQAVYTWAQSEENKANDGAVIYSFNVTVPNEKGTYSVGLSTSDENKVVPIDQNSPYSFKFYGLDIVVDGSGSQDPPPAGSLVYNLVPNGKNYDSAETKGTKTNVYKAEAGESLKIDWTVKGDPGTAGIQMNFDFTQVTYESASRGNAYRIVPTYSDYKTTTNLKQGECIYTWAQSEENKADDGKVIYSFNVKVPNEKGTYSVGLKSGEENKVVPIDQTKTIPFTFYGLDIVVGEKPVMTEQPPVTTEQPPVTTTTKPEPIGGSADWMIGQKEVAPGGLVKIPVLVYNDEGTAGFALKLDMDSSLKIDSIDWTGAYSGEPTLNPEQRAIVWASTNGSDQSADGAILYLNITAPETDGNYPIRFEKLDVTNTVGAKVDAKTRDGGIKVDRSILDAGSVNWEIGQAAVKPGDTAKVPVKVSGDSGTAGFTVRFEHDPELKFTGFEFGDGYSGEAQMNDDKLTVVWANSDGSNEKADGDIIYLKFTAPDKEGEYPVGVSFIDVSNTLGQNLKVNVTSGSVKADPKIGSGDTPSGLKVVKSYDVSFTPPTRKNYWSHDTRTLKNCGGLDGMRAEMTVYKAYVNDKNEFTDVHGETMKNANGQPVVYEDGMDVKAQAFETRTKDITDYVDLSDPSVTAKMIWDGQADSVTKVENHKYRISLFYDAAKQTDEDFKVSDSKIKLGDHTIFIGVKGDYNLDDVVSVDDAQNTLRFYTEYYVANKKNTKLSENPEYDGLNGLVFYLINVRFLAGDSPSDPMEDPQQVSADDAQCILRYYTDKDVAHKQGITWEKEVGYDLLDSFYQK